MISAVQETTWTVVISRGQSRNPEKRGLEQAIADAAEKMPGIDVLVIPHLYDLPRDSQSYQELSQVEGNLVVVSWIFERAAHWVLDRNGIRGQFDPLQLDDDVDEEPEVSESAASGVEEGEEKERVTDLYPRPDRGIHCIDLKSVDKPDRLISEIRRLVGQADPEPETSLPIVGGKLQQVDETTSRRWYPVIDFNRCTNCMECVDFCLFGVYGVDGTETILVEQPDNCRKGCPACSRVCPENAIIFPQHKAPAIAGAETEGDEGFKIDLSQLFGAPAKDDDPIATAARERD